MGGIGAFAQLVVVHENAVTRIRAISTCGSARSSAVPS